MSTYLRAKQVADQIMADLAPACQRIEIAGGVRREKPECHDVELVAIPKMEPIPDIFGGVGGYRNLLNEAIEEQELRCQKNGDRYKKIILPAENLNVDLFIVLPPAQWGVIFTLRTGPADFSKRIVTQRKYYGSYLPSNYQVKDGAVLDQHGKIIPTPEEMDFLKILGLGWIEPKDRK